MNLRASLCLALTLSGLVARADEGMWLSNQFPSEQVKARYGFSPSQAWLDHLRLGSVRLARGCSGSFVSHHGLVLTNHHCAQSCIKGLSSASRDLLANGFFAKTQAEELRCPDVEVNQLTRITDVTDAVNRATAGKADAEYNRALKAEMSRIEAACAKSDRIRCDVVTLFNGGRYHLYEYRRYQDVRLVFAPEFAAAFFGGDPDNFEFPRYDLDLSFMRAYEDGKPVQVKDALRFSTGGLKEGDLTFVSGHPGSTARQLTVSQLEYRRDVQLPYTLTRLSELRGQLTEFAERSPEARRVSASMLFGIENSLKALKGRHAALSEPGFFQKLKTQEQALRAQASASGAAWDDIDHALLRERTLDRTYRALEGGSPSELFSHARALLRAADERTQPNEKRLREYAESALPAVRQRVLSAAPIDPALEKLLLTFTLTKLREELGPDHPVVRSVLGKRSPSEVAGQLVQTTQLMDPKVREQLWNGGKPALDASGDPLIALARTLDGPARAVRKQYEDEVEAVVKRASEAIARVRFQIQGTGSYPDATFTLRVSYGQVKGYLEDGKPVAPFTRFRGAFERDTGAPPYALPPSWLAAKGKLKLETPLDFVTTNDIIGGNSGSPVVNREAEVVGLIFDGNVHSLALDFGFEETQARAVAVDARGILEALDHVYGAQRLVQELRQH